MKARLLVSILLPFIVCVLQWWLWGYVKPYVWFLFFPVAYFSAWIGGMVGGITATLISALLVWYVFIPPAFSFELDNPATAFSIVVFIFMGLLFAFFFERLRQAKQLTDNQLQTSKTNFRRLFQEAPVPMCYVDKDGALIDFNHRFQHTFGYNRDDIPTLAEWWQLAYPDPAYRSWVLDTWNAAVARAAETGSDIEPVEYRVTCKIGKVRIVLISGIMLGDELLATLIDITERVQNETVLRENEALLKQSQILSGIGNWTWDTKTDRHIWSDEIYRIYGRDPALPAAVYPEVQQYFTPESWSKLATAVEKGLAKGVTYACDAEVVRPDGTHRWITARGEATRDASGNIIKLHGTVQDITGRKHVEEEIRRLNADLERRVVERTAELTSANRELDSFAYAVSHDLRAPLRAMSGFSHALIEDCSGQLDNEAKSYLQQIIIASNRMSELIDGLLVLSRSTRGELQHDAVDLSSLAQRLLAELAQNDPGRKVAVHVESGLQVYGDVRMIDVVMRNLLDNAWKYSAWAVDGNIRVYAEDRDNVRRYCVSDNGAGFDMAHINRLFQPFQRLHRQEEFPGIGIGLATVQRIVHRHGGIIEASGEPGKGAIFCFTLPGTHLDAAQTRKEA